MQLNYEQQLEYIQAKGVKLSRSRYGIVHNGRMYILYEGSVFDSSDTVSLTFDDFELLVDISEGAKEELSQKIMMEQIDNEEELPTPPPPSRNE